MIRIGTRSSKLALWQANTVAAHLEELGHTTSIIKIDSLGARAARFLRADWGNRYRIRNRGSYD